MAARPPAVPTPTTVYIDGFNLYYGELKGTSYKWLDLQRFFSNLMGPRHEVTRIKYFTARVIPTQADPQINNRQDAYFQALEAFCPLVEIYLGHFLRHSVTARNVNPPPDMVRVWKTEEKGSDVNLAVHVLNDAWLNAYQCAVIVSNDSDLAASLKMVKQQGKLIGLVTPWGAQTGNLASTSCPCRFSETYSQMDAAAKSATRPDTWNRDQQAGGMVDIA